MPELYIEGVQQSDFRIEVDGTVEPGEEIADHPSINDFYDGSAAWIEFSSSQSHELSAGGTTYWHYSGSITSFNVRSGEINVEVNGNSVTPGQLVAHYDYYPMDRVVVAAADDATGSYDVEVQSSNGSATINPGSGHDGSATSGSISDQLGTGGWSDFYYDGQITKFNTSGSVTVYHNCQQRDPSELVEKPYTPPQAAFNTQKDYLNVTFDASPSEPGSEPIQGYEWNIGGRVYAGETVTHQFSSGGTYNVELTVYDNQGEDTVSDTVTVSEQQTPPTADFTFSTDGLTLSADASASSPGSNQISRYEWTVGSYAMTGQTIQHTFDSPGTYTVQLSVYDSSGLDDTTSTSVTVEPTKDKGGGGSTAVLAGLAFLGAALVSSDDNTMGRVHDHVKDDNLGAAFDEIVDEANDDDESEE